MPQDAQAHKEQRPGIDQPVSQGRQESRWFTTPRPVKQLFNRFPLRIYSSNKLPQRAAVDRTSHNLYIFTTDDGSRDGLPSFNPGCLKWQAYLKFIGIEFRTVASNNHASPTGALPFLVPSASDQSISEYGLAVPSTRLEQWACTSNLDGGTNLKHTRSVSFTPSNCSEANTTSSKGETKILGSDQSLNTPSTEHSDLRHKAYMALLDNRIRNAWLYFLYLEPSNFAAVATPLYITPCSSNLLVRVILAHNLRAAAKSELLKPYTVIDVESLYVEGERAFSALSELLGHDKYFFDSEKPGFFDASVFAYTNVLLDGQIAWQERRLIDGLRRWENLVSHRERIVEEYF